MSILITVCYTFLVMSARIWNKFCFLADFLFFLSFVCYTKYYDCKPVMINNWLKMKRKKVQQRDQLIEQVVHNKSSVLLSSPSFH